MLSREQQKLLNIEFWNEFRKFMNNQKSSNGKRINWLNYPSDVKNLYIRLQADGKGARLCLDIQPKDDGIRSILWEQMAELKKVMENTMTHETIWLEKLWNDEGRVFSRIMWQQEGLDFYILKDRELIFLFLKNRLIEFDTFYQEFKEILISLTD